MTTYPTTAEQLLRQALNSARRCAAECRQAVYDADTAEEAEALTERARRYEARCDEMHAQLGRPALPRL